jgi:hypothetical protein
MNCSPVAVEKKQKLKIINIAEKASTKADRMYQEFNYL